MKKLYSWSRGLQNLFRVSSGLFNIARLLRGSLSLSIVKTTYIFLYRLNKIRKDSGITHMCKYLKTVQILIIKRLGNDPQNIDSHTFGIACSVTRTGYPRVLPIYFRNKIRARDRAITRFVLTICNLYRVLPYDGKLSLASITDKSNFLLPEDLEEFLQLALENNTIRSIDLRHSFKAFEIVKSGAFMAPWIKSSIGWFWALLEIIRRPNLKLSCIALLDSYPQTVSSNAIKSFVGILDKGIKPNWSRYFWWANSNPEGRDLPSVYSNHSERGGLLGKLSLKWEPGKIRVFAMVDSFSQWVLKPLHLAIFDWLRGIKTCDGTFDQVGAISNFYEKLALTGEFNIFSYDLSAATDRLPLRIQEIILNNMIQGKQFGTHWATFLTDRTYRLGVKSPRLSIHEDLRYITGQPMGAYSSWGMLALTHHILVQLAAWRVSKRIKFFDLYIVLGDDIIIGDPNVAEKYYDLMVNELKVKINLSKSIVSPSGFSEYAKKLTSFEGNWSPISLGELSSWEQNPAGVLETLRKNEHQTIPLTMRLLGKGPLASNNTRNAYFEIAKVLYEQCTLDRLTFLLNKLREQNPHSSEEWLLNELKVKLYIAWWDVVYTPARAFIDSLNFRNLSMNYYGKSTLDLRRRVLAEIGMNDALIDKCPLIYSPWMTATLYGADDAELEKFESVIELGRVISFQHYSSQELLDLIWDCQIDKLPVGLIHSWPWDWTHRPHASRVNISTLNWNSFAKSLVICEKVLR